MITATKNGADFNLAEDFNFLQIQSIEADLVIYKGLISGVCTGELTSVVQNYGVSFVTSDQGQGRSGNPGYLAGYPLLVG